MLCHVRSPNSTVCENRNEGRANYSRSPSSKTRPKSTIVCKNEKPFDPLDSRGKSSKNGANETDSTRSKGQDSNREIGTVKATRTPRRSPAAKTCSYEGINDVRCGNDRGNDTRSAVSQEGGIVSNPIGKEKSANRTAGEFAGSDDGPANFETWIHRETLETNRRPTIHALAAGSSGSATVYCPSGTTCIKCETIIIGLQNFKTYGPICYSCKFTFCPQCGKINIRVDSAYQSPHEQSLKKNRL